MVGMMIAWWGLEVMTSSTQRTRQHKSIPTNCSRLLRGWRLTSLATGSSHTCDGAQYAISSALSSIEVRFKQNVGCKGQFSHKTVKCNSILFLMIFTGFVLSRKLSDFQNCNARCDICANWQEMLAANRTTTSGSTAAKPASSVYSSNLESDGVIIVCTRLQPRQHKKTLKAGRGGVVVVVDRCVCAICYFYPFLHLLFKHLFNLVEQQDFFLGCASAFGGPRAQEEPDGAHCNRRVPRGVRGQARHQAGVVRRQQRLPVRGPGGDDVMNQHWRHVSIKNQQACPCQPAKVDTEWVAPSLLDPSCGNSATHQCPLSTL